MQTKINEITPEDDGLTDKQRVFIEEYLHDFNATQAAKRAGYSERTAYSIGHENLKKPEIQAAIQARIAERVMSADEVLLRLAEQARASMADFIEMDEAGQIKVSLANMNKLHLVKQISLTAQHGLRIELYDAQDALKLIGQHHKLFTQKHEVETPDLAPLLDVLQQQVKKVYGDQD